MSQPGPTSVDLDRLAPEAAEGLRLLPVIHERVELAGIARAVLDTVDPAAVAVEIPTSLEQAAAKAVDRLPQVSLVISEEPGEGALVWVVTPGDPLVEAIRWAREKGCTSYDLWGVPDADEEALEAQIAERHDGLWGVYRFKRGFGGTIMRAAQSWGMVFKPMMYKVYQLRMGADG